MNGRTQNNARPAQPRQPRQPVAVPNYGDQPWWADHVERLRRSNAPSPASPPALPRYYEPRPPRAPRASQLQPPASSPPVAPSPAVPAASFLSALPDLPFPPEQPSTNSTASSTTHFRTVVDTEMQTVLEYARSAMQSLPGTYQREVTGLIREFLGAFSQFTKSTHSFDEPAAFSRSVEYLCTLLNWAEQSLSPPIDSTHSTSSLEHLKLRYSAWRHAASLPPSAGSETLKWASLALLLETLEVVKREKQNSNLNVEAQLDAFSLDPLSRNGLPSAPPSYSPQTASLRSMQPPPPIPYSTRPRSDGKATVSSSGGCPSSSLSPPRSFLTAASSAPPARLSPSAPASASPPSSLPLTRADPCYRRTTSAVPLEDPWEAELARRRQGKVAGEEDGESSASSSEGGEEPEGQVRQRGARPLLNASGARPAAQSAGAMYAAAPRPPPVDSSSHPLPDSLSFASAFGADTVRPNGGAAPAPDADKDDFDDELLAAQARRQLQGEYARRRYIWGREGVLR
ncbi:hypothetical protein JCM10207_005222 [Rhodosporidiobolus poonsookiae]